MRFFGARRVSAVSNAVCIVREDAAGVRRRADVVIDFKRLLMAYNGFHFRDFYV